MLVCYALDARSAWWTLGFAASCVMGSAYGFLQGAWPFGLVEGIWSLGGAAALVDAAPRALTRDHAAFDA